MSTRTEPAPITQPARSVGQVDAVETPERAAARKRLEARRDFRSHLVAYVVVNSLLVVVWLITGAGYFWPAWVIACWAAGLLIHAWDVYVQRPVTEHDVDEEMRR